MAAASGPGSGLEGGGGADGREAVAAALSGLGEAFVALGKAILAIDEGLEDASVTLADRIGLLDSAWRREKCQSN